MRFNVGDQMRTECGRHAVVVKIGDGGILAAVHYGEPGDYDYEMVTYRPDGCHYSQDNRKTSLSLVGKWQPEETHDGPTFSF